MDGKRIRCLQIVSQHVPIYLQQFPSYSNRKCKKSPSSRIAAHILVSPGDAPATITQCISWMERQFNACGYFYHIFVYPGDAPGAITLNVVWMEREFDAYKLSRCMCPSNYNRSWDRARYWSKIVIFHTTLAFDAPVRTSVNLRPTFNIRHSTFDKCLQRGEVVKYSKF